MASTQAHAAWVIDGTPVSSVAREQSNQAIVADGAGGAILVWKDDRSSSYDIYAQRLNSSGNPQWTANGIALCTSANTQYNPAIVSDGAGGAIVTWLDFRSGTSYDVYAQRVNASGTALWTANGVAICTAANDQFLPTIIADGAGGAIITWHDNRSGTSYDLYAQRVNASGSPQWTTNGVPVSTATNNQSNPVIVSDGASGAIISWQDNRGSSYSIYAQRLNASGVPQWTANGVGVCTAADNQLYPMICSDGTGGAIITWQDHRDGVHDDIYAQRVSSAGAPQWPADGVAVSNSNGTDQQNPVLVSDGAGGAIITWAKRYPGGYFILTQRLSGTGNPYWLAGGIDISGYWVDGGQVFPTIASDTAGGAVIAYPAIYSPGIADIWAQHVDASGQYIGCCGVSVCTSTGDQQAPMVVTDATGNAIIAWVDARSGTTSSNDDIYAQRIEIGYAYWGHPEPVLTTVKDIRHDNGGKVALNWTASGGDAPSPATIDYYTIWRAVDVAPASATSRVVTPLDKVNPQTPLHTVTTMAASSYYWELIGTQDAYRLPSYSFAADTRADSVAGHAGDTYFMIAAHAQSDPHVAFTSNVVSGHSVDNLAPSAPLSLTAQRIGNYVHLKWRRVHVSDLKNYRVYRKTTTGVTPVPGNLLGSSPDTVLTDTSPPASSLYYIVTATDVHANEGKASNEASVAATTGAGDLPPITTLMLLQNRPNPFSTRTELEIGLPLRSDISVEVYDVAGRRVATRMLQAQAAGWQRFAFDGRDNAGRALSSGVYFFRVSANSETLTRKIVIAR